MSGGGTGYLSEVTKAASSSEVVYTAPSEPVKETYVVQPKRMLTKGDDAKNIAIEFKIRKIQTK